MKANSFSGSCFNTSSESTGMTRSATASDTRSAMSMVEASGANIFPSIP